MTTQDRINQLRDNCTDNPLWAGAHSECLAIIAELEARLAVAQGALNPIREQDWHGKWRVQKALAATDLDRPFAGPA